MADRNPSALHHGQVWRSTNNRFYWIMTRVSARPEVWLALDIEGGQVRHFYASTRVDRNNYKNKLTRIYGHMQTPAITPGPLAMEYQSGTNVPMIARLNRGLLRTFSGKLIKEAEPSRPKLASAPSQVTSAAIGDTLLVGTESPGLVLNVQEGNYVKTNTGDVGKVVGVYRNNPWKYHVSIRGTIRSFRADGTCSSGMRITGVIHQPSISSGV